MHTARKLGDSLAVNPIGLGCMGMSGFYGRPAEDACVATIHAALERGVDLFDTADRYGLGKNEELLGRALRAHPEGRRAVVATKFGIVQGATPGTRDLNGSPTYLRSACEASLRRLGRDVIDLYYLHRVDRKIPIEETIGAMGDLVREGKVRFIGVCEVSAATLRRAHATHPVAAVQSEYSLWCRSADTNVLPTCRELGVGFVAYAPLGLGFLTGRIASTSDFVENDYRPTTPRFQGKNFERNRALVTRLVARSHEMGASPAQLALSWVLARGEHIVALPGTTRVAHLEENLRASSMVLDEPLVQELSVFFPQGSAYGERYNSEGMTWLNG